MLELMAGRWWAVLLRGIVALGLGVVAFAWPGITIGALLLVIGVYVLLSGLSSLIMALQFRHETERWWPWLLRGVVELIIGAIIVRHPIVSGIAIAFWIGIWAVVVGILEIVASARMRRVFASDWSLGASGVISILLGIALIAFPGAGIVAVAWMIGFYAVLFGVFQVWLAIRLERLNHGKVISQGHI